jgi:hypothetical protein
VYVTAQAIEAVLDFYSIEKMHLGLPDASIDSIESKYSTNYKSISGYSLLVLPWPGYLK